jgi:hypothetical protein
LLSMSRVKFLIAIKPNQKHQPYVLSENTRLGFQLAGAAGCRLPPSPSQLKSQPCISGEYVGLMFLVTGAAGVLVWPLYHNMYTIISSIVNIFGRPM